MTEAHIPPIDAAIAQLKTVYVGGGGRAREDVDDTPRQTEPVEDDEQHVAPADELFWPPPELEPLHGQLPRITSDFAMAALILVGVVALGALDDDVAGWGVVVALLIDALLLVNAYSRLRQLLMAAQNGIARGYPRPMVWHVAADSNRDLPLLLQSRGIYTDLSREDAAALARLRTTSATFALLGMLWPPLSFPLLVVIGMNGMVGAAVLWLLWLAPAAVLLIAAGVFRLRELNARRPLRLPEAVAHETAAQVAGWSQLYARLGVQRPRSRNTLELKLASAGIFIAVFILLVPIALAAITAVVPRIAASMGGLPATTRLTSLDGLKHLRLPSDSSISAVAAGQALHNLSYLGRPLETSPLVRPPTTVYSEPIVDADVQLPPWAAPQLWPDSLFYQMRGTLPPEQRAAVEQAARHPAHAELATLGRAARIDIPGTRWRLQQADSIALAELPFGHFASVRNAANAHVARAALQWERGDLAAAEETLREVLSAGLLLRDEGVTLIDAFIGSWVARAGAAALAGFYDVTGRPQESARVRGHVIAHDAIRGAAQRGGELSLEDMQQYVLMRSNPRPARWEVYSLIQTIAPCSSLRAAIFGPNDEHDRWLGRARAALVREPGEAIYFDELRRGLVDRSGDGAGRCTPQVLRGFRRGMLGY